MQTPVSKRFWSKVQIGHPHECWEWTAGRNDDGYGRFRAFGGPQLAHRLSYEEHHGPVPVGLFVLHSCDNRGCVNPNHLRAGTAKENTADMIDRGRHNCPFGERAGPSKLTEESVRALLKRLSDGVGYSEAGREFGLSRSGVRKLALGRTWKHVPRCTGS
jgi:hypothetical protein